MTSTLVTTWFALTLLIFTGCHHSISSSLDSGAAIDHSTSLLGGERGLDHVGVAVRDLEAATRAYHDVLGFSRPIEGKLPNGIRNVNYYFADSTYLETLTPWDRDKAAWLASFVDHHNGALFGVLSTYSPEATRTYLAKRGLQVGAPFAGTIQTANDKEMPAEKWRTFFLPDGYLAGDPLYFISYPRADREAFLHKLEDRGVRRGFYHENTALGLRSLWIAVPDLDSATRAYESIGLIKKDRFVDARMSANAQSLEAGAGEIWLMAPTNEKGAVADFLRERGPGIIGMTLLAGSVPAAARLLAARTGRAFPSYEGRLGNSIRVPPDLTFGPWIEFAQYLVPPSKQ